jgi:glycosyltransferase involved in cell wall biosynthesis
VIIRWLKLIQHSKIAVGIVTYNCVKELKRCLDSLKDFEHVIVIDGKWFDFDPNNSVINSTDGTIELAKSYPNTKVITTAGYEYQNRQMYIDEAAKLGCKYLFWVDSDEYVKMDKGYDYFVEQLEKTFENNPDKFASLINFHDVRMGGNCWQIRLISHLSEMKHRDRHNQIWYRNMEVIGNHVKDAPDGIRIYQEKNFRTPEREELMRCRNLANPIH